VDTLSRLQRGLEELYRVETGVDVDDYVIDPGMRDAIVDPPGRKSREQLLVGECEDEASIALFIDPAALANLQAHDPARSLGDHNLQDFLLAVEGVSHFIYAICCARADRRVTQLELELQAEVDKYVTCLLVTETETRQQSSTLRRRLFEDFDYEPDLDHDEHARYRAANDNAQRYSAYLEHQFVTPRRIPEMLGELRRFYRLGLAGKLSSIARAA
jgi:hypothetical protein